MPKARGPTPKATAYVEALKLLGRRELSEEQIRRRLVQRAHPLEEIDAAVERLKSERAIDDERVAGAIARMEASVRHRGRLRVSQELARAGIRGAAAKRAIDETFAELDEETSIETALAKRLRDGRTVASERDHARLYRYLVGQGFEPGRILATLARHRRS
jgi:regulatory protein